MAKKKSNILVKLIIDSREKEISWLKRFKFDKKYSSEKIMIEGYEIHTPFKCLDGEGNKVKMSTADIGIMFSTDEGETWKETNLAIELKRDSDMSSTIYSNWDRFCSEVQRSKDYELDFYIVFNQSTKSMLEHFAKLKAMRKISVMSKPEKVYYDRYIELCDMNVKMIYTHDIPEVIKRIVKNYIKKNKLQY